MRITNLIEITRPTVEPIDLARAKLHLRAANDLEDGLISGLIASARRVCENATSRAFVARPFRAILPGFPWACPIDARSFERDSAGIGPIMIPRPPLLSVDSIGYFGPSGSLATLPESAYIVNAGGELQGSIEPAPSASYPPTQTRSDAVRIDFTAGYGPNAADVPEAIGQAMLLLVGLWYDARSAATEVEWKQLPFGVRALLAPFRWGGYG